jgi:hypothetical protein
MPHLLEYVQHLQSARLKADEAGLGDGAVRWALALWIIALGAVAAPPSFESPPLPHVTSWIGNTYPGEFTQPLPSAIHGPQSATPEAPSSQGWWVDARGNVWLATETKGLRFFPSPGLDRRGNPVWSYDTMQTFPHPAEFKQVKRVRYVPETDTVFLAGTTDAHPNQHWKPGGPVLARYDGWLKGGRKLRWTAVAPYASGSNGHSSCEPMGFDVAGDFIFVPYTGASKPDGVKHGRVEVFRAADGSSVGHFEPSEEVGEIGLQDIRECLVAHRRAEGEFIIFLEDDYKSKVILYRLSPGSLK